MEKMILKDEKDIHREENMRPSKDSHAHSLLALQLCILDVTYEKMKRHSKAALTITY